jgi:hypothetical protein
MLRTDGFNGNLNGSEMIPYRAAHCHGTASTTMMIMIVVTVMTLLPRSLDREALRVVVLFALATRPA